MHHFCDESAMAQSSYRLQSRTLEISAALAQVSGEGQCCIVAKNHLVAVVEAVEEELGCEIAFRTRLELLGPWQTRDRRLRGHNQV